MGFFRALRAILWGLFGIRKKAEAARDAELQPAMIAAAAFFLLALVIGAIATGVHVIGGRATRQAATTKVEPVAPPRLHGPITVADTLEERARPCIGCHSDKTQATGDAFSPRIAGKPAGYLFNQLVSFRDGRRSYAAMVYLVQYMNDDYLWELADYFSKLELPYAPAEPATLDPAQAARAQQLVQHGDAARDVPACAQCHGADLAGHDPSIPSLLGLPRQYMTAQFGAWRNGRLRAIEPDCMSEIARRLDAKDVPLLAAWLAQQPPRPGAQRDAMPRELPLKCGSLEARRDAPAGGAVASSRGAYLVAAGDCIACHTAAGDAPFAGGRAIETPFGSIYASNITADASTGIGAWSRDDFWRALHEGRSRDGRLLYPAFPYANFTQVTREDADAMYDYLRGVPPVARANSPHALRFPYGTQAALMAWRALFFRPGAFQPEPARGDQWNRGAYLVRGLGHCDACHAERNMLGAVSHDLDLGGGLIPMQKWYAPPLASSLGTDHVAAFLKSGATLRGTAMGPMAEVVYRSTQRLSEPDVRAIAKYLESLSPSRMAGEAAPPDPESMLRGAAVYADHCSRCHGDQGEGAAPAYPALAGNQSVTTRLPANVVKAILYGGYAPVTAANPRPYGMPPFLSMDDREVAAVATYIRSSWNNRASPVSTLEVENYR
jgi:cytochrome c553